LIDMEDEWDMAFLESGEDALEKLQQEDFDIIVSDMLMPKMDGAELLEIVKERHPSVIRFILSGYSDNEMILRSLGPAHQFLAKPCTEADLKAAVVSTTNVRAVIQNKNLASLITHLKSIPSIPAIYNKLLKAVQNPDVSMKEIGAIISTDVGMTAKLLQIVNSSFFGIGSKVSEPAHAASLLGIETIKALVLIVHVFDQFDLDQVPRYPYEQLSRHSMAVGNLAARICRDEMVEESQIVDAMTIGVLHDLGVIILAANLPERYSTALKMKEKEKIPLVDAEMAVFRTSHAEVGAYLMGLWGLPDSFTEVVAFHHNPSRSMQKTFSSLTAVHVADSLQYLHDNQLPFSFENFDEQYLQQIECFHKLERWYEFGSGQSLGD
jgi:HD-like signal output (HDOD) protein